jgi:hypothetical protein
MGMNLELEQADRLFQSGVEQSKSLTVHVRVTNSDHDEKVSALSVFTWLVPLTGLRYWTQSLQAQKAPPMIMLVQSANHGLVHCKKSANVCVKTSILEDPEGALPLSEAKSQLSSTATVEPSADACMVLRGTGMPPSLPPNLD